MSQIWFISALLGLALEFLVVGAIHRSRAYRRYPLLFAFCLILLFTSVIESAATLAPTSLAFRTTQHYKFFYWINENVMQCLTFALMVSMIYRAMEGIPTRRVFCTGLSAIVLLIAAVAVVLLQSGSPAAARWTTWMTSFCRTLSFVSALLNFILWSALVRQRRREAHLLLTSAGLGLVTTGKAIGHSLRAISVTLVLAGNLFIVFSMLLCLFLWWWTFRHWREPAPPGHVRPPEDSLTAEGSATTFSGAA